MAGRPLALLVVSGAGRARAAGVGLLRGRSALRWLERAAAARRRRPSDAGRPCSSACLAQASPHDGRSTRRLTASLTVECSACRRCCSSQLDLARRPPRTGWPPVALQTTPRPAGSPSSVPFGPRPPISPASAGSVCGQRACARMELTLEEAGCQGIARISTLDSSEGPHQLASSTTVALLSFNLDHRTQRQQQLVLLLRPPLVRPLQRQRQPSGRGDALALARFRRAAG